VELISDTSATQLEAALVLLGCIRQLIKTSGFSARILVYPFIFCAERGREQFLSANGSELCERALNITIDWEKTHSFVVDVDVLRKLQVGLF
jgi:hypothetical protein